MKQKTPIIIIILLLIIAGFLLYAPKSGYIQDSPTEENSNVISNENSPYYLVYTSETYDEAQDKTYLEIVRETVNGEEDTKIIYTLPLDGKDVQVPFVSQVDDYIYVFFREEGTNPIVIDLDGKASFDKMTKLIVENGTSVVFSEDKKLAAYNDKLDLVLFDIDKGEILKRLSSEDFEGMGAGYPTPLHFTKDSLFMDTMIEGGPLILAGDMFEMDLETFDIETISIDYGTLASRPMLDPENLEIRFVTANDVDENLSYVGPFQINSYSIESGEYSVLFESEYSIKNLTHSTEGDNLYFNLENAIATLTPENEADTFIPAGYVFGLVSDPQASDTPTNELVTATPDGEYLVYFRTINEEGTLAVHKFKERSRLFANGDGIRFVGYFKK